MWASQSSRTQSSERCKNVCSYPVTHLLARHVAEESHGLSMHAVKGSTLRQVWAYALADASAQTSSRDDPSKNCDVSHPHEPASTKIKENAAACTRRHASRLCRYKQCGCHDRWGLMHPAPSYRHTRMYTTAIWSFLRVTPQPYIGQQMVVHKVWQPWWPLPSRVVDLCDPAVRLLWCSVVYNPGLPGYTFLNSTS